MDILASESTRRGAPDFVWQELDRVRVKGKQQSVAMYRPAAPGGRTIDKAADEELQARAALLEAYRARTGTAAIRSCRSCGGSVPKNTFTNSMRSV